MSPVNLLAFTLALVGLAAGCSPSPHRPAPGFALRDRAGDVARLSDYRGQVVALNFWATWCPPCRFEIPWLNQLQHQYRNRGLAVLGVSMDEKGWQAVIPFLDELHVDYRVMLDTAQTAQRYGAGPPPTTFLIDREGRIVEVYAGVVNRKAFENRVRQLLLTAR